MAEQRRAETMTLSGNQYAKVAERLKLFREDWPKSKTQSIYEYEVDKSVVFTVYLWKDKADYLDVLKEVKDVAIARESADANGTAKGEIGIKQKDFEKLETIALGRALAMMGYLASGDIASFEEQQEFERFRKSQLDQQAKEIIGQIEATTGNQDLNKLLQANSAMLKNPTVVAAAKKKQAEFAGTKPAEPPKTDNEQTVADVPEKAVEPPENASEQPKEQPARPRGGKPVAKTAEPQPAALPLEEPASADTN